MYLSYVEYQDMGGTLDEAAFNDVGFEAQARIDWYTFGRLKTELNIPEEVKRCMFYLIRLINDQRNVTGVGLEGGNNGTTVTVASQSNDGVSVSYAVLSASEASRLCERKLTQTVRMYLQGVKNSLGQELLYRGLYKGE